MAAQILSPVDFTIFDRLVNLLTVRPLPVNQYRKTSGVGRSQSFGLVKQRDWTYSGSRLNYERIDIYEELVEVARRILPDGFTYTSIQVNQNYQTAPHRDKGNRGISCIIGFGEYEGGDLLIEGGPPLSIRYTPVLFDGSRWTHSTDPFTGSRFSLVFFTVDRTFTAIPSYSFVTVSGKICLSETLDDVTRVYTRKGNLLSASDSVFPPRKMRTHTLRSAREDSIVPR